MHARTHAHNRYTKHHISKLPAGPAAPSERTSTPHTNQPPNTNPPPANQPRNPLALLLLPDGSRPRFRRCTGYTRPPAVSDAFLVDDVPNGAKDAAELARVDDRLEVRRQEARRAAETRVLLFRVRVGVLGL